jgi:hypothetical protein
MGKVESLKVYLFERFGTLIKKCFRHRPEDDYRLAS